MPDPDTLDGLDRGADHDTELQVDEPPDEHHIDDIDKEHYLDTIGG